MFSRIRNCAIPNNKNRWPKKYVETYSSFNAAAKELEERVQLNRPKHYTICKADQTKKEKTQKKKKRARGDWDDQLTSNEQSLPPKTKCSQNIPQPPANL